MDAITETRDWISRFVVGLGLCPFAAGPLSDGRVRFALSAARTPEALLVDLRRELALLERARAEEIETALLVHPFVLTDFTEFNDFLDVADLAVAEAGLLGVTQIASFHPRYRFEGEPEDDVANATNRSPHPMLHLIREASITRALAEYEGAEAIPERNVALLRALGWEGVRKRGSPD